MEQKPNTLIMDNNVNHNNDDDVHNNNMMTDSSSNSSSSSSSSSSSTTKSSKDKQKLSNLTRSTVNKNEINGHKQSSLHNDDDDDIDNHIDDDDDDDYEPEESKDYYDVDYVIGSDVDRTTIRPPSNRSLNNNNSKSFVSSSSSSSLLSNKKRKSSSTTTTTTKNKKPKKIRNNINDNKTSSKSKTKSKVDNIKTTKLLKKSKTNNSTTTTTITTNSMNQNSNLNNSNNNNNFRHLFQPNEHNFEQILPPELLTRLFQLIIEMNEPESPIWTLIRLSQVCEHWRQIIITNPILWTKIDLSSLSESRFPMERFFRLHQDHQTFQSVQHINLSNWKAETARKMLEFLMECTNNDLLSLNIKCCRNITASFLQSVLKHADNLQLLNISGITASQQHNCQNPFQTPSFRPLIEKCGKTLRSLYMSENIMTSFPTCFSMVLESCPNLEVLDISNVHSLGSRCSTIPIDKFQQCCPNIRILRAANIAFQSINVNGGSVGCINTNGWSKLEELSIPFNVDFMVSAGHTDVIIEQLTKSSENLKLLDVRGSPSITPRGLVKIPAWSLQHLSISNCPKMQDETLGMVFQKWNKSLIDVDISWNKSESCIDECVRSICDVPSDEVKLRTIDLRGSAISLESLRRLILHCNEQLISIDLQSCRSLPRGMKRLFQGLEFQRLKQLMLDGRCDD